jgi:hypothetical protein
LFPNKYLALALLAFAFAVPAAQGGEKDSRPAPSGGSSASIETPSADPSSLDTGTSHIAPPAPAENLPDDPSATPEQQSASQQDPGPKQPTGGISSEEQLRIQEKQRVFGVMAAFNTTTNRDAMPLTPGQKFQLFFKSQTDPWPFGLAAVIAGFNQADNSPAQYGQGMQGYAKRFGATYTDAFIGNFWGNAVLPSLWHEDPRYFQKGTGSTASRILWASTSTVWCRRDNGSWGPNYSNVVGNLIGAAIANVYYPESERTVGDTVTRGLTVTAEGIIGSEVIEFWPDILRHYRRKQAEKLAKKSGQQSSPAAQVVHPADDARP